MTARDIDVLHIVPFFNPTFSYLENHLPLAQAMLGQDVVVFAGMSMFPDHSVETYRQPEKQDVFTDRGRLSVYPCRSWFIKKHPGLNWCDVRAGLKFKPKIVYIHGITTFNILYGIFFNLFYGSKILVDCHNDFSNESRKANGVGYSALASVHGLGIRALLKLSLIERVISIGHGSTNYCIARLGLSGSDIKEIGLGYDSNIFYFTPRPFRTHTQSSKKKQLNIGVIGKFSKEKNLASIADFVNILRSKNNTLSVTLAGTFLDRYSQEQSEKLCSEADRYRFVGVLNPEERKAFFDEMDFCIWAGRPSILIQECIGSGCPAFVSDHQSTLKFIFEDYFFSEKGDNRHFFKKLKNVCSLQDLLKNIQAHQKQAIAGFSWNEIAYDLRASFD